MKKILFFCFEWQFQAMNILFFLACEQALLFGRASPRGFAARSRVLAGFAPRTQIGELARRLYFSFCSEWQFPAVNKLVSLLLLFHFILIFMS